MRAILVDDEETGWKTLRNMLSELYPELEIVAVAGTVAEAVNAMHLHKPDLLFLDISLPDGDGFKVLEHTKELDYSVIFVTAHHEYAIKAFEFAALHYLLKPVNALELQEVLKRYKSNRQLPERLEILKNGMNDSFRKIALPAQDSILFVDLDDVVRCEASHNYTIFHLKDKSHVVMSKSLRYYEKLLENSGFFRIHDKHLVNLGSVVRYRRGKGGSAVLSDGSELEVSVRKKDDFLKRIALYMPGL